MKQIGICINGVMRDFIHTFERVYMINNDLDDINKAEKNGYIKYPLNPYKISNITDDSDGTFYFQTKEELYEFVYSDNCYSLFANALTTYDNVINDLNEMKLFCLENNTNLELISKEVKKSIPSTMLFLATIGCQVSKYRFTDNNEDFFEGNDLVITDNPNVINSKPEDKKVLKINHQYNSDFETDFNYNNLKEVKDDINNIMENI